jgi:hypothetical protein
MAPEVTLECTACHHQAIRPAHIDANGCALVSWPNITCGCGGKMVIIKKVGQATGSAVVFGSVDRQEVARYVCECEKALENLKKAIGI